MFKEIKHRVPQGSVLGPHLFLLYINDLPLNIQDAKLVLFADYFNILIIGKNMVTKQFETWFSNNRLIVNTDKMKAVVFHLNKTCNSVMPKIIFKNVEISYTFEVKFLGINISYNLKLNTHIQFLCSKLNNVPCMISSLRGDLSLFMLKYIYFTKFQYLIRYGIILWGGERESVKVLKIRKRFFAQLKGLH